ncbi:MAG: 3-methyl-2-oxobutanoate dehydrogenase subunit beta [candidate division WOR-3 bacterium]|nr:3-methyl-2-oxobutanoate dehydrogenase subunit beta [candidate division WOR-3 bacterium]MDW7987535.1 3-methyl-2-oxobutanoate dehydrogenase subunit beta [candidate division WOR-3 bacterium]
MNIKMESRNFTIPEKEYMFPGHVACPGCGGALAMRLVLKALGEKTIVVIPACCWTIIDGPFPMHSLHVPVYHTAFETAAVAASGIKAALEIQGKKDITVLAWAGDGGTLDIGIQSLSGVAERNDDIIYACYDNEAYMNTGIQRSSATPKGAWTTTTPVGNPKGEPKKNISEIMISHRIPYVATATLAYPDDLINKFRKAQQIKGTKFIHIFAPCPTGWKMAPELMITICRLAVLTNIFPLYECENGVKYTINIVPEKPIPVREYLKLQGRFSHLQEKDIEQIQKTVDFEFNLLLKKAQLIV